MNVTLATFVVIVVAIVLGALPLLHAEDIGYSVSAPSSLLTGVPLTVQWTAPEGHGPHDWIAVFKEGASDWGWYYPWYTLEEEDTEGVVTFHRPPEEMGVYEVRLVAGRLVFETKAVSAPIHLVHPGSLDVNPLILVPGVGGSVLHAQDKETGSEKRVWVEMIPHPDQDFRSYVLGTYNEETGSVDSLDHNIRITFPTEENGLKAIRVLDPELEGIRSEWTETAFYFHDAVHSFTLNGYDVGETLFGFPYDWRQSNDYPDTQTRLEELINNTFERTRRRVDLVSHSMGGLVVATYLARHFAEATRKVRSWVAIACPFHGGAGLVYRAWLHGYNFGNIFVRDETAHSMSLQSPSTYQLAPDPSFFLPSVSFTLNGEEKCLSGYDLVPVFAEALKDNVVEDDDANIPMPWLTTLWDRAQILRQEWETLEAKLGSDVQSTFLFFNLFGHGLDTPYNCTFEDDLSSLSDLTVQKISETYVDGDGTVPRTSAADPFLKATLDLSFEGEHQALVKNGMVLSRILEICAPCPHDCNQHGACHQGVCRCEQGFSGVDCGGEKDIPRKAKRREDTTSVLTIILAVLGSFALAALVGALIVSRVRRRSATSRLYSLDEVGDMALCNL